MRRILSLFPHHDRLRQDVEPALALGRERNEQRIDGKNLKVEREPAQDCPAVPGRQAVFRAHPEPEQPFAKGPAEPAFQEGEISKDHGNA